MRTFGVLCLATAAACASSSSISSGRGSETVRSSGGLSAIAPGGGPAAGISIVPGSSEHITAIASPIDPIWRAMPGVYQSFSIPLTRLDQKTHIIGNEGFKALKTLGGVALSKYIECGTTQIGPNADSYEVHLSIVTQLTQADNGTTKLTTNLEAAARPMQFAQEYARCSSKGVFEQKLADAAILAVTKK